jgi:hypothetical protein
VVAVDAVDVVLLRRQHRLQAHLLRQRLLQRLPLQPRVVAVASNNAIPTMKRPRAVALREWVV